MEKGKEERERGEGENKERREKEKGKGKREKSEGERERTDLHFILITTAYPKQFQNLSFHHIWSKISIQWNPSYKDTLK